MIRATRLQTPLVRHWRQCRSRLSKIILFMNTILPDTNEQGGHRNTTARYTPRVFKRKNQISRAQCRVKSGTASAESGAESEEEICDGAVAGKVHVTSAGANSEKSCREPAAAGRVGGGCVAGAAARRSSPSCSHSTRSPQCRQESRLGRRHRLKPDEHQAQNDGGCPFHAITLTRVVRAKPTGGWLWRVTFCPVSRQLRVS